MWKTIENKWKKKKKTLKLLFEINFEMYCAK